jgi:hypothetical protein
MLKSSEPALRRSRPTLNSSEAALRSSRPTLESSRSTRRSSRSTLDSSDPRKSCAKPRRKAPNRRFSYPGPPFARTTPPPHHPHTTPPVPGRPDNPTNAREITPTTSPKHKLGSSPVPPKSLRLRCLLFQERSHEPSPLPPVVRIPGRRIARNFTVNLAHPPPDTRKLPVPGTPVPSRDSTEVEATSVARPCQGSGFPRNIGATPPPRHPAPGTRHPITRHPITTNRSMESQSRKSRRLHRRA